MQTSIRQLVEAEARSRYEGEPSPDVMQEAWVAQFLAIVLGTGEAPEPTPVLDFVLAYEEGHGLPRV